jgi:thiol:disulfide interchange protein
MARQRRTRFGLGLKSVAVWLVMVVVLVVVPDTLEQWMPLNVARVIGWVLASGIWVAVLEREWQARFGPVVRFTLQIVAWLGAALLAIWISDQFRAW